MALARSCLQYGRFSDARTLLSAAGAQGELLSLCVFQGDFLGLQDYARQVRGSTMHVYGAPICSACLEQERNGQHDMQFVCCVSLYHKPRALSTAEPAVRAVQAGRDVERLADQLMAVNENAFVHGSSGNALYGGRPNVSDWSVTAGTAGSGATGAALPPRVPDDGTGLDASPEDGEVLPDTGSMPLEVDVAPAGRLPFQEASLQVRWGSIIWPVGDGLCMHRCMQLQLEMRVFCHTAIH